MPSLPSQLSSRIEAVAGVDPELRPATKPQFGHFQSNVALRLAKSEGRPPREVAASIVQRLDLDDLCEPVEIAGPGFLNLRLRSSVLAAWVTDQLADPRAGIVPAAESQVVVIVAALVMMAGLYLFVERTRTGKSMRAVSEDPEPDAPVAV